MLELTKLIRKQVTLLGQHGIECVIIGGVAATLYGSALPTRDLDVCYARNAANLEKLAIALQSVHAKLRNAPEDLPFILDAETLRKGLNFTFATDVGPLDLLGEVRGVGFYEDAIEGAVLFELFGYKFRVLDISKLITAKQTAGRIKDLPTVVELEAIRELQAAQQAKPQKD